MYCLCNHFYISNPHALAILYNVMVMPIKLLLNLNLNLISRSLARDEREQAVFSREGSDQPVMFGAVLITL